MQLPQLVDMDETIALGLLEVLYSVIKGVDTIETCADFRRQLDEVTNVKVLADEALTRKFHEPMQRYEGNELRQLFQDWAYNLLRFIFVTQRQSLLNLQPAMLSKEMLSDVERHCDSGVSVEGSPLFNQIVAVLDRSHVADRAFEERKAQQGGSFYAFEEVLSSDLYNILRDTGERSVDQIKLTATI